MVIFCNHFYVTLEFGYEMILTYKIVLVVKYCFVSITNTMFACRNLIEQYTKEFISLMLNVMIMFFFLKISNYFFSTKSIFNI